MNRDEHLRRWVCGESLHNWDEGACCPDYSCCFPEEVSTALEEKMQLFSLYLDACYGNISAQKAIQDMLHLFTQRLVEKVGEERMLNHIVLIRHGTDMHTGALVSREDRQRLLWEH